MGDRRPDRDLRSDNRMTTTCTRSLTLADGGAGGAGYVVLELFY
jgi:hypothetical protein